MIYSINIAAQPVARGGEWTGRETGRAVQQCPEAVTPWDAQHSVRDQRGEEMGALPPLVLLPVSSPGSVPATARAPSRRREV
jgi:hypothetical protein